MARVETDSADVDEGDLPPTRGKVGQQSPSPQLRSSHLELWPRSPAGRWRSLTHSFRR